MLERGHTTPLQRNYTIGGSTAGQRTSPRCRDLPACGVSRSSSLQLAELLHTPFTLTQQDEEWTWGLAQVRRMCGTLDYVKVCGGQRARAYVASFPEQPQRQQANRATRRGSTDVPDVPVVGEYRAAVSTIGAEVAFASHRALRMWLRPHEATVAYFKRTALEGERIRELLGWTTSLWLKWSGHLARLSRADAVRICRSCCARRHESSYGSSDEQGGIRFGPQAAQQEPL